jgi:hypothetical protein
MLLWGWRTLRGRNSWSKAPPEIDNKLSFAIYNFNPPSTLWLGVSFTLYKLPVFLFGMDQYSIMPFLDIVETWFETDDYFQFDVVLLKAETEKIISCHEEKDVIKRFPRTNDIFPVRVIIRWLCFSNSNHVDIFCHEEFLDFFDNDDTDYCVVGWWHWKTTLTDRTS